MVSQTPVVRKIEVPGFGSRSAPGLVTGPLPQGRQLVMILPIEKYDLEKEALVGIARGVQWWIPGTPVTCKLVNRGKVPGRVLRNHPVARLIAVNTRDSQRFHSLFHHGPSTTDPPSRHSAGDRQSTGEKGHDKDAEVSPQVQAKNANCGQLGRGQKKDLESLLETFIAEDLFPLDPKRVAACVGGELSLPLIDEKCTPVSEKQRSVTPEEVDMIRLEVQKLTERGIIRPSNSQWAA